MEVKNFMPQDATFSIHFSLLQVSVNGRRLKLKRRPLEGDENDSRATVIDRDYIRCVRPNGELRSVSHCRPTCRCSAGLRQLRQFNSQLCSTGRRKSPGFSLLPDQKFCFSKAMTWMKEREIILRQLHCVHPPDFIL